MPQPLIDSHHHLWAYDPAQYPWIDPASMGVLAHDHTMADLREQSAAAGVVGTIAVQAQQNVEETDRLIDIAKADDLCRGVVGWLPLMSDAIDALLEPYLDQPELVGVRHVIQDEPDPAFMLGPAFLRGLAALQQTRLCYDVLIFAHQLPNTIRMIDRFPEQVFVLDHAAKPAIDPNRFDKQWASQIAELARRPNVWCKLSGLATEVPGAAWDSQTLSPYIEHILDVFGPRRLMFGSDWPVCKLKTSYPDWVSLAREQINELSPQEQSLILHDNALEAYRIT